MGRTALQCAAIEGNSDIMETLIGYGVDINTEDIMGHSALQIILHNKVGSPPNEILSPQLTKVGF